MSLRFGTDGVRGVAGRELTAELVLALGRAAARVLGSPAGATRTEFLIGRDTRWSGPLLQAALAAGLASEGADVVDLGVLPTPGVAALAGARGAAAAVISASHNPFGDNGIKLFAPGGRKLTGAQEAAVEAQLTGLAAGAHEGGASGGDGGGPGPGPDAEPGRGRDAGRPPLVGDRLGRYGADPAGRAWYCGHVVESLEGRHLDGIRVVIDCANGAAVSTATEILTTAGADVVEVLSAAPDGRNINAGCGSTDPSLLAASVVRLRGRGRAGLRR